MDSLDDIYEELQSLVKGYISKKKINGHDHFYLQWRDKDKVRSRYLKKEEIASKKKEIEKGKILLKRLSEMEKDMSPVAKISDNALNLSGDIMIEDEVVASFERGTMTYENPYKSPLSIHRNGNLEKWLLSRSIDSSRINAQKLKSYFSLRQEDELSPVLINRALSITDPYWFRVKGSKIHHKDLAFSSDAYFSLALEGERSPYLIKPSLTPELTTRGSYEKGWKIVDDEWWLYKKGSKEEVFSEWFASSLAIFLGIPSVQYEIVDETTIRSKNFAQGVIYEPLSSLADDDDTFEHIFEILKPFGERFLNSYLILMWFDCLVHNVDRHTENMGIVREIKTGQPLFFAPNYDDNMCLFASGPNLPSRQNDGLISLFKKFLASNVEAGRLYSNLLLPQFDESSLDEILKDNPFQIDEEKLKDFLLEGKAILAAAQR